MQQIIRELERELATRNKVYPRWISEGKIAEATANHRRDCISEAGFQTVCGPLPRRVQTVYDLTEIDSRASA